ncbi:hypothetical protein GCM10017714_31390 [Curtobacterium pusillum]|uniref:Uncharacterized protein n=1 Tax=Curtobacterium pusillum TaxID=69373 RepID=A0ABX2M788_9MICO|nr:hypothetical protein [Curtobacterium pusillum]NUU13228.1 hypothetical protein [Curtobacterium pusillum]GLK31827.1 hypothetical protein GCM10017610_21120 [Curtobacterium pusillum]
MHLTIHDVTAKHDKYGDSLDTQSVIGEADIDCGVTVRIPIDVPKGRDGIMLDASTADTSGRALFDSFVVTRGSDQGRRPAAASRRQRANQASGWRPS